MGGIQNDTCFSSRQYRGITYVKEVAEKMEKVMQLPGGIYNFGSETTKSMYEITKEFSTVEEGLKKCAEDYRILL